MNTPYDILVFGLYTLFIIIINGYILRLFIKSYKKALLDNAYSTKNRTKYEVYKDVMYNNYYTPGDLSYDMKLLTYNCVFSTGYFFAILAITRYMILNV
ncbi:MAG: hypothetical protein R3321_11385 [Nitrososphaeraceae archaeon]|nr:hypothetical protein [Nitrososphaeraceae archaeon]